MNAPFRDPLQAAIRMPRRILVSEACSSSLRHARGERVGKRKDAKPAVTAAAFGVGKLTRHLLICIGPDCVDYDEGEQTWKYLKQRMKELDITGSNGPFYRTKCDCLRICNEGPICVVYPEGTWYRRVTPQS